MEMASPPMARCDLSFDGMLAVQNSQLLASVDEDGAVISWRIKNIF